MRVYTVNAIFIKISIAEEIKNLDKKFFNSKNILANWFYLMLAHTKSSNLYKVKWEVFDCANY